MSRLSREHNTIQGTRSILGDFDSTCLQLVACSTNESTRGDVVRAARTRAPCGSGGVVHWIWILGLRTNILHECGATSKLILSVNVASNVSCWDRQEEGHPSQ